MTTELVISPATARDVRLYAQRALHMDAAALLRGRITAPQSENPQRAGWVDLFTTTPFGALGMRRVHVSNPRGGTQRTRSLEEISAALNSVIPARNVVRALDAALARAEEQPADGGSAIPSTAAYAGGMQSPITVQIPKDGAHMASWPGALPPRTGFTLVDTLEVDVVARMCDEVAQVAREESGPAGIAPSLLDQTVISVTADGAEEEAPAGDGAGEEASAGEDAGEDVPTAAITSRILLAARGLGFIGGDTVRVSTTHGATPWVRLDFVAGTVYFHRGNLGVLPLG